MACSVCNNGSMLEQDYTSDNTDIPTKTIDYCNVSLSVACIIGCPSNLLVIAIYMRNLSSSAKLYMFTLAVADLAVCFSGVVFYTGWTEVGATDVLICVINLSVTLSMFILAFASIERFTSIWRPHSFKIKTQQVKTSLIIITVAAVVFTIITTVARLKRYKLFNQIFQISTLLVCLIVMTTYYIMSAVIVLHRPRAARKVVAFQSGARSSQKTPPTASRTVDTIGDGSREPGHCTSVEASPSIETVCFPPNQEPADFALQSAPVQMAEKQDARRAACFTCVPLMCIVAIVFHACLLPHWLTVIGFEMSPYLKELFILNAVIKSFIYGVASAMFREDVQRVYRYTRARLSACYY